MAAPRPPHSLQSFTLGYGFNQIMDTPCWNSPPNRMRIKPPGSGPTQSRVTSHHPNGLQTRTPRVQREKQKQQYQERQQVTSIRPYGLLSFHRSPPMESNGLKTLTLDNVFREIKKMTSIRLTTPLQTARRS